MKKGKKHRFQIAKSKKKVVQKIKNKNNNISNYSYKIGNKSIKLTVERVEVVTKSDLTDSIFYYTCVFCKKDFDANLQVCPDCSQLLVKVNLKKCPLCGAKNNPAKQTCWVCNGPFPKVEEKVEIESQVLLTLNVNGNFYRNTDKVLGLGMRKLFDDLIAANFSKEPLEAWVKIHEGEVEFKKEFAREECKYLAKESKRRNIVYLIGIILPVIICLMLFFVFWSK